MTLTTTAAVADNAGDHYYTKSLDVAGPLHQQAVRDFQLEICVNTSDLLLRLLLHVFPIRLLNNCW